jgi:hypothetical protein
VVAAHDWLAGELADWGAQDDALLTRALNDMARQFVDQDPELAGNRAAAALPGGGDRTAPAART